MNDSRSNSTSRDKSWLNKIALLFNSEPRTRKDVEDVLAIAAENEVIDQDACSIIVRAMQVSDMQARDIMIPRSQMVLIKAECTLEEILPLIISSAHSRYPVIGDSPDDVMGILLAKDLLPTILETGKSDFKIDKLLRPSMVVPESKRLNVLLREFRENRNHMAIVIDEYGGVAGLVTIEDVLEEIVGEIEDETDERVDRSIQMINEKEYMVKALTPIDEFNHYFACDFSDEEFDTVGGLIIQAFGHMPVRHETTTVNDFAFVLVNAAHPEIYTLRARPPA